MLEYVDEDQLAEFLGGKNTHELKEDWGPWKDFEVVDGDKKGDVVGIRRKGEEGPPIFTPQDLEALPNPRISPEANEKRQAMLKAAASSAGETASGKEEEKKSD